MSLYSVVPRAEGASLRVLLRCQEDAAILKWDVAPVLDVPCDGTPAKEGWQLAEAAVPLAS